MAMEVTLYTRRDCPLCDKAKSSIRAAIALHRLDITFRELDIDTDANLRSRFNDDVPVVYIDGREAFRHHLTPEEFTQYVRGGVRSSTLAGETCVPCRGG